MASLEAAGTLLMAAPSSGSILHQMEVQVGLEGGVVVTLTPVRPNPTLPNSMLQWY